MVWVCLIVDFPFRCEVQYLVSRNLPLIEVMRRRPSGAASWIGSFGLWVQPSWAHFFQVYATGIAWGSRDVTGCHGTPRGLELRESQGYLDELNRKTLKKNPGDVFFLCFFRVFWDPTFEIDGCLAGWLPKTPTNADPPSQHGWIRWILETSRWPKLWYRWPIEIDGLPMKNCDFL